MAKQNCWEFMQCGRQEGGPKAAELGVCPVSIAYDFDGVNDGYQGGRFCWAISETLCAGERQGNLADKALNCMQCAFYQTVVRAEGANLIINPSQLMA